MADKKPTFEEAMEQLNGIVAKLSSGNLPLEEMVKLYEEGGRLSSYCETLLDGYTARVEIIEKRANSDYVDEA